VQDALIKIEKKYNGRVVVKKFAFPLSEATFGATEAVLCVKSSGKRKIMSGLIYKNQGKWKNNRYPESLWKSYAKKSGADLTRWEKCIKQKDSSKRIKKSRDLGLGLGVRVTPTFFIGEIKMEGSRSIGQLKRVIERNVLKLNERARK
tara:strand:+ start:1379 stop:1822 length:444 start_codon:yes stop_codon:yes gene_type:complete